MRQWLKGSCVVLSLCTASLVAQDPNWVLKSPNTNPPQRLSHAMAYDAAHGQVVMFGGVVQLPNMDPDPNINDTWVWDGTNWTQEHPLNSPGGRSFFAMAYDAARGQVVMFGGSLAGGLGGIDTNETWVWDGTNWTLKNPVNSPTARNGHAMAYDAAHGQVVMFGGLQSSGNLILNDTWVWDGTNWTLKNLGATPAPPQLFRHSMAYDAARGQVVMFGGSDSLGNKRNDTWVWDGTSWTLKNPVTIPTGRFMQAMAYDAAHSQVVMFGGDQFFPSLNDTWVWDGTNWTQENPVTIPTGRASSAAYDAAHSQVVMFGGWACCYSTLFDTWVWSGGPLSVPVISTVSPSSGTIGSAVIISGDHFGSIQGTSVVRFNSLIASVTSWSNISIKATIPTVPALNLSYDISVTTSQGPSNSIPFLVNGSSLPSGPKSCSGSPRTGPQLISSSTTRFSVLLIAKQAIVCSTPDAVTVDITLENNWKAWYFVSLLTAGSVGQGLPQHLLLPPGDRSALQAKRTFRLTFKRGESISFFADASFNSTSPQTAQDFQLLDAFALEFLWRLSFGSPLPPSLVDFAVEAVGAGSPIIALGIALLKHDIPGILTSLEGIAKDPIISTKLTAFGLPIAKDISIIGAATKLFRVLDFLSSEFIAAIAFPNDTLTIRAQ